MKSEGADDGMLPHDVIGNDHIVQDMDMIQFFHGIGQQGFDVFPVNLDIPSPTSHIVAVFIF